VAARRALAALALLTVLASGCSLAGRSLGGYVDDAVVRGAVKRQLASERIGHLSGVTIDTFDRTVYLSGVVDSAEQKSDAEIVAWRVDGVRQVVNDLVVARAPAPVSALPDFGRGHPLIKRLRGVARVERGRPGGPDLAYDQGGRVVASVYLVEWREVIDAGLETLPSPGRPVDHVSTYVVPDRRDRPGPFYAIVLWHVSERDAAALR